MFQLVSTCKLQISKLTKLLIPLIIFASFFHLTARASTLENFIHPEPIPVRNIQFFDEEGMFRMLDSFAGKVLVLNFWTTWCQPCVEEMPLIEKLKENMQGRDVEVIALSIDYKGIKAVKEFYQKHKISNLPIFIDEKGKSFKILELRALPTTLIINKEGDEVARVLGQIAWDSKEVKDYLVKLSKQEK